MGLEILRCGLMTHELEHVGTFSRNESARQLARKQHTLELLACAIPSNSQDVEDFEVFLSPVPGPPLELLHRVVDFVLGD